MTNDGTPGRRKPLAYREKEVAVIAQWIEAGESGAVVGMAGAGRANLLNFLCRYPAAITQHFTNSDRKVAPIPIDLNNLPAYDLSTFYRVILRAFYEGRAAFEPELHETITNFYYDTKRERDPFVSQSAVRELLAVLRTKKIRVVLVMDKFGYFCEVASPRLFNTLRGLRDSAKQTLCYIIGLSQDLAYLPHSDEIGALRALLDGPVCWVGTMTREDAETMIEEEMKSSAQKPSRNEVALMLKLTGHHPALLKATCRWWRMASNKPGLSQWSIFLLDDRGIQNRLQDIWGSLSEEERLVLSEVNDQARAPSRKAARSLEEESYKTLSHLADMGLCYKSSGQWYIRGKLLADFVAQTQERGRGRIRIDPERHGIYQGPHPLDLTDQQERSLRYFLQHPRERLSKMELIMEFWPDEWEDVDEARLYQLIRQLRQRIEPNPSHPAYLVKWQKRPDSGYQFFPEGRAK